MYVGFVKTRFVHFLFNSSVRAAALYDYIFNVC
jgi:hypothetical protein